MADGLSLDRIVIGRADWNASIWRARGELIERFIERFGGNVWWIDRPRSRRGWFRSCDPSAYADEWVLMGIQALADEMARELMVDGDRTLARKIGDATTTSMVERTLRAHLRAANG